MSLLNECRELVYLHRETWRASYDEVRQKVIDKMKKASRKGRTMTSIRHSDLETTMMSLYRDSVFEGVRFSIGRTLVHPPGECIIVEWE